jgi:hypothetical protein
MCVTNFQNPVEKQASRQLYPPRAESASKKACGASTETPAGPEKELD